MKLLKIFNFSLLILIIALFCFGCKEEPKGVPAFDKANMDLTIKPGNDFFRYANGNWIKNLTLPDEKTSYGAFDIIRENVDKEIQTLLTEVSKKTGTVKGSSEQKISDFFFTGMDSAKIETDGFKPLVPEFEKIAGIKTMDEFQNMVAEFHSFGLDPLFGASVFADLMNSKVNSMYLMQAGIGLPNRDYYVNTDSRSIEIRTEYEKHIAKMFELVGEQSGTELAKTVMNIETELAKASKTNLELRNIPALYNKMNLEQLQKNAPNFNWKKYFENLKVEPSDVIVGMPLFTKRFSELLKTVKLDDWKVYLRWNLLNRSAEYLHSAIETEDYKFNMEFLSGTKKMEPRWKRVVAKTNGYLGEPLGELYVAKYFPKEYKQKVLDIVANLKKAFKLRLEKNEWMTPQTKQAAIAKLETMKIKIGYPDKWEDYSKLEIERDSYISNARRANRFQYFKNLAELGKPVDNEKWGMSPQTVNAGYSPLANDITFPAGILQFPFFNPTADDAINYGGIGMVIGHEMTHGFDDQGRNFDKDGNMINWWQPQDAEEFGKRTKLLVEQYNGFVAIDSIRVNGELSLGENIADFGGLTISLEAYKLSLQGKEKPADIDGLTDIQRFFLANAQVWRGKIRNEYLIRMVQEDVHPWGEFRVNGAPFNVPEFYAAFGIKPEDKLYRKPEQRPIIW